jgi:zinc transporter, ZIP family
VSIVDLSELPPVLQAVVATGFTWALTAVGAAVVFLRRQWSRRMLDGMLGFAAGVMIAASYWSLLAPAIALGGGDGRPAWLPAAIGFLAGGLFLRLVDAVLPHVHLGAPLTEAEGVPTRWRRSTLLVLAVTLHNIPEGLAVGVAFGAAAAGSPDATVGAATALAIGIGIQNLPEGAAVALPLRREGLGAGQAFWYGQLTGMVEPVAAVIGAAAVLLARPLLPYALAFAAGAMIFVVVEELIPEAHRGGHQDLVTAAVLAGFTVMMILDVALA